MSWARPSGRPPKATDVAAKDYQVALMVRFDDYAGLEAYFAHAKHDEYLAKHGYDAQMIDEPEDPNRPNNLWAPLPGDAGAHGVFDDRSRPVSIELELNKRRGWLAAGAAFATFAFLLWKQKRNS